MIAAANKQITKKVNNGASILLQRTKSAANAPLLDKRISERTPLNIIAPKRIPKALATITTSTASVMSNPLEFCVVSAFGTGSNTVSKKSAEALGRPNSAPWPG